MDQERRERRERRSDAHRNRDRVAAAAVTVLHRDGPAVPMATIAAAAGVGVGTVYRHFPTREDLFDELTTRSFRLMVTRIRHAAETADTATGALRLFLVAVVGDRHDLVLPSTGGPAVHSTDARTAQDELHAEIRRLIARGAEDGTVRRRVDVWDIAWLGATLAQPGRDGPEWDAICLRLLDTYLAGLGVA